MGGGGSKQKKSEVIVEEKVQKDETASQAAERMVLVDQPQREETPMEMRKPNPHDKAIKVRPVSQEDEWDHPRNRIGLSNNNTTTTTAYADNLGVNQDDFLFEQMLDQAIMQSVMDQTAREQQQLRQVLAETQ